MCWRSPQDQLQWYAYADRITDFCVSASQIEHQNSISSSAWMNMVGVIVAIVIGSSHREQIGGLVAPKRLRNVS
jgi:hypothetical protein